MAIHIGSEVRRARIAVRHRLVPSARAKTAEEVAESLVAVHATDPRSAHISTVARLATTGTAPLERALYEHRTLLRMTGMRRTMVVVPADLVPIIHASSVRGWAQRSDGEIVWRLLTDAGAEAVTAVEAEAARLAGWLGSARVTPSFRTPLERELSA